jgi:hypothetical protein
MRQGGENASQPLDLLLVGWDGLGLDDVRPGETGFWPKDLADQGISAGLSVNTGGRPEDLWAAVLGAPPDRSGSASLFALWADHGLSCALVNPPWPLEPGGFEAFFIGRPAGQLGALPVHPASLADDLADYLPDPAPKITSSNGKLARGWADLYFAEQAAICRIRFEHTLRLARDYTPQVLAVSLTGYDPSQAQAPGAKRREISLRAQLSYYALALEQALAPRTAAILGFAGPQRPGLFAARGPGLAPGSRPEALSANEVASILDDLVQAEALKPGPTA